MDNPGEILRLCRLCLVKDQVNIPIFEEQGDIRQIFLKISSCLPVKVSRDDKLPKKICDGCSNKLDLLYEFWNTSANAEKTLLSWLGQAGVKDADETISAVAQQIAKPAETQVKQEALEDGHAVNQDSFQVQSLEEEAKDESEAPPPKRARRTAAVKAQINITPESDDDDDMDAAEAMTKVEGESDESDGEDKDPSYGEVPGTSADDQAGPSGLGKDGVEAPYILIIDFEDAVNLEQAGGIIGVESNAQLLLNGSTCDKTHETSNGDIIEDRKEIKEPEEKNTFMCELCGKKYPKSLYLKNHVVMQHTHEFRFFCQFCKKGYYLDAYKRKHEKSVHLKLKPYIHKKKEKLDRFTCSYCGAKFTCNVFLQDHIANKHTKNFKYFCETCNKGFYMQGKLEYHVKHGKHLGNVRGKSNCNDSTVPCGDRNRKSKYSSSQPVKSKYPSSQPVSCPVEGCGKIVSCGSNLGSHMAVHRKEKYVCKYCTKVFTAPGSLSRHLKAHETPRTFLCDICGKNVSTSANLRIHKRIHTGERPAQCEDCGKRFLCTRDLNIHRGRYHKGLNVKFLCGICKRKFQVYGKLKQHYTVYHPNESIPDENADDLKVD